ncbi:hypothetical protein KY290_031407 [Solanum tuberosum]|uniref:Homeobox domain-containing protein n=1 Tax=Solanum tuberosum TaxID=4113 RepID=A0ABQ7U9V5_SOLTU|nr:hypothetical protein KY290_031407 [Solanum tuberosum]
MEALFKECPKPDEKKMKELSGKVGLEFLQIKFWFQNFCTQIKIEGKRYENSSLRAENDKLRIKCVWLREAINNGCLKCCNPGCPLNNEQYLRLENARLQEENTRGNEPTPNGIKTTASRESAFVIMNHINLVEIFMDTQNHWANLFSSIVLTMDQ